MLAKLTLMLLCIGTLIAGVALTGANAESNTPIAEIAKDTKQAVDDFFRSESAQDVYATIRSNVKALDSLIELVEKTSDRKRILDAVVETMEKMTTSFEEIAAQTPEIERGLREQVEELQHLLESSGDEIEKLRGEKRDLQNQVDSLFNSHLDADLIEIRKRALSRRIEYIGMEIQTWEHFVSTQDEILRTVQRSDKAIRKFVFVLNENATVYRGALRVIKLRRDLQRAMEAMSNIAEIEALTAEVIDSWEDLKRLVDNLMKDILKLEQFEKTST